MSLSNWNVDEYSEIDNLSIEIKKAEKVKTLDKELSYIEILLDWKNILSNRIHLSDWVILSMRIL